MDVFKQVATVIAHREVKRAEEVSLGLTKATHLVVPWRQDPTGRQGNRHRPRDRQVDKETDRNRAFKKETHPEYAWARPTLHG